MKIRIVLLYDEKGEVATLWDKDSQPFRATCHRAYANLRRTKKSNQGLVHGVLHVPEGASPEEITTLVDAVFEARLHHPSVELVAHDVNWARQRST